MKTPTIKTERLTLRPFLLSDAQDVFDTWTTDSEVSKFMRWNTHTSLKETTEFITLAIENIPSPHSYDWIFILNETGKPIGSGGLYWKEKYKMFELGYCLAKKAWGQGFAVEASVGILDFAKQMLNEDQFFAEYVKENSASGRVLEKLGFVYHSDGEYSTFDGKTTFQSCNYFLR